MTLTLIRGAGRGCKWSTWPTDDLAIPGSVHPLRGATGNGSQ